MVNVNFKIILAGDETVGKTNLIRRNAKNKYLQGYNPTLVFEIIPHGIQLKKHPAFLANWDIAGQTAIESICWSYYKGNQGFLLVFNLAIRTSRRYLEYWGAEIRETCPNAPFVLLGNKSDRSEQKVTLDEMKQIARNLGAVDSILISAKTR